MYCRTQLGQLAKAYPSLQARRTQVVAISVDPSERSRELHRKLRLPFPILADPELAAIRAYGIEDTELAISRPAFFLVRPDGSIAWEYVGDARTDRPDIEMLLTQIDRLHASAMADAARASP
ncbi:MAG: peroxiredoxin family protein [Deltaproteobacteria bacterium]|nr:peroxiredoxin family protein [Deltaproteobacteria bacterium]